MKKKKTNYGMERNKMKHSTNTNMLFIASARIIEDGFTKRQLRKAIKIYKKEFTLNNDFIYSKFNGTKRDRIRVHYLYKCLKSIIT